MSSSAYNALSLIDIFDDFFANLLRLRQTLETELPLRPRSTVDAPTKAPPVITGQAAAPTATSATLGSASGVEKELLAEITPYSQQVAAFLQDKEYVVIEKFGKLAEDSFREAKYIMTAFADEFFLNFPWQGQNLWDACLVEMNLFNSHVAGDLFFDRLDDFLSGTKSKTDTAIGILYYYALCLGFQGKYRGDPGAASVLHTYKHRLFLATVGHHNKWFDGKVRLYPSAYNYTVTDTRQHLTISPKWWWGLYALVICILVIISHIVWTNTTREAFSLMSDILSFGLIRS